jgi:hypothetical protein
MNLLTYKENNLPVQDLERIGLASGGQLLLNIDDMKALMSGRRTGLLHLENLEAENIRIKAIDAKISLHTDEHGKTNLLIHPIYRKPEAPDFLEENEALQLENGETPSLLKITTDSKGNKKEVLVEYDGETREFIVSDTELILAPDMVNNEFLTAAQKKLYRNGKEVKLADGTVFSYSGVDNHGIRSNKLALIASILIDGGLSYVLYKGLNTLFNKKRETKESESLSPGYVNAQKDMENQRILQGQMNEPYTKSRTGR